MHWRQRRKDHGTALVRCYWKRYSLDDNDPMAIFRSRQVEKMKLRKKTRGEVDSFLKMKQLLKSSTGSLEQCHNVLLREQHKKLCD